MPTVPFTYTRLTRSAPAVGSYKTLWLGDDHLLTVASTGYGEEYQRLRLRDIKGFFVIDSDRRLWWGLPWGIVAALSGATMVVTLVQRGTPIVSTILFILSGLIVIWNHCLGVGCKTYVVTGVQTALIPSLVRRRKTANVLARLRPLIEAAQADLKPRGVESPPEIESPLPPPLT